MASPLGQPSSTSNTHNLTFPTIEVDEAIASLASSEASSPASTQPPPASSFTTPTMRSHQPHSSEALSSLEDSSYEILGDSQLLSSDDEGNTESLASNDVQTPDDILSVADTEDYDDGEATPPPTDEADHVDEPEFQPSIHISKEGTVSDSGMTARPNEQSPASSLRFAESIITYEDGYAMVTQTINEFREPDIPAPLRFPDCPHVALTVKQILAPDGLKLDRPFRLLYVGDPTHWAKEEIINKIASALAVTADFRMQAHHIPGGPSRYNVIPISAFGVAELSPEVQLIESSGVELIVDECSAPDGPHSPTRAPPVLINGELKSLSYQKEWGLVCDDRPEARIPLPDLAVFFHQAPAAKPNDEDRFEKSWPAAIRRHIERLLIRSTLDVSITPMLDGWPKDYFWNPSCLRLCVEDCGSEKSAYSVLKDAPVDLKTFLDVDSARLNRHIAWLTGLYKTALHAKAERMKRMNKPKSSLWSSFWDSSAMKLRTDNDRPFRRRDTFRLITILFFGLLLVSTPYLGGLYTTIPTISTTPASDVRSTVLDQNAALSSALVEVVSNWDMYPRTPYDAASPTPTKPPSSLQTRAQIPSKELASVASNPEPAPTDKPKPEPLPHPFSPRANESDEFKAHVIGDHHFVLTPPQHLAKLKKQPQVTVTVMRGEQHLDAKISKLVEGVYAVELGRGEAYGSVDVIVTVTTAKNRHPVDQTLTLNFGSPWLKLHMWTAGPGKLAEYLESLAEYLESLAHQCDLRLQGLSAADSAHNISGKVRDSLDDFVAGLLQRAAKRACRSRERAARLAEKAADAREKIKQKSTKLVQKFGRGIDKLDDKLAKYCDLVANVNLGRLWQQAPCPPPLPAKPEAVGRAQRNAKAVKEWMGGKMRAFLGTNGVEEVKQGEHEGGKCTSYSWSYYSWYSSGANGEASGADPYTSTQWVVDC